MVSVPLEETVPYSDPLITVQVADSVTSVTLSQIAVNEQVSPTATEYPPIVRVLCEFSNLPPNTVILEVTISLNAVSVICDQTLLTFS